MGRRIAVYGGSFNPFASHHEEIARWLVEEGGFGTVIVVPAAAHALKDDLPEFLHRYNMAELGVSHMRSNVRVSTVERDMLTRQPAPVRTYELLSELAKGYGPDDEIRFAIGPDIPGELDRWHNVDKIEKEFGFVHIPLQSMRATKLREMIGSGLQAWHHHVSLPVRHYIETHGLYRDAA